MTQANKSNESEMKSGLFDNNKSGTRLVMPKTNRYQNQVEKENVQPTPKTSDEAAQQAANALAHTSSAEEKKRQEEADKANRFSEEDVRLIKECVFRGFCEDTIECDLMPGYRMKIKVLSMCTNEYDFLSQIIFDYKKDSSDKDGYPTICQEKFDSLFGGLLMAMQIQDIDGKPVVSQEKDLLNVKSAVKNYSKLELMGITDENKMEELRLLKDEIVNRAFVFMNMENNVQSFLNNERAKFNNRINKLLGQDELIKK